MLMIRSGSLLADYTSTYGGIDRRNKNIKEFVIPSIFLNPQV